MHLDVLTTCPARLLLRIKTLVTAVLATCSPRLKEDLFLTATKHFARKGTRALAS